MIILILFINFVLLDNTYPKIGSAQYKQHNTYYIYITKISME